MEFRVLGPVEIRHAGRRVPLSGTKLHTVLAALLLAREEVVSDDQLSYLLWGWAPPATMSAQIYTYVSRLRKIIGDETPIKRRPPGYVMSVGEATVDLFEFEKLDREGRDALRADEFTRAGALLRDALARWNGTPFANATDHLAQAEAPRLTEARAATLEDRITADLALGRHERLVVELTGLVAEFPLRERLRSQLIIALCRCGRQAEAIHLYHDARAALAEELGVDPGEELQATYQALINGTLDRQPEVRGTDQGVSRAGGAEHGTAVPGMLPPDTADFIGRERELELLCRWLTPVAEAPGRPRRVLVTGMAGIGKTALAVHAAHRCLRHFPDGQLYADLRAPDGSPLPPGQVLLHLLRALCRPARTGNGAGTEALDELVRDYRQAVAGKQMLILLDNACDAAQLAPLLPNTPEPAVLVTGRTALPTVTGSHTVALEPLAQGPAMALLTTAAGSERLAHSPGAASVIVECCAGLPLALRIVGTRLAARPHYAPDRLARRLVDPATRLRELHAGDLSVHTALLPSLRALAPEPRQVLPVLARLGVEPFPAVRAAERLGLDEEETEPLLEALVDGALLEVSGADVYGRPCYRFHPLVGLFARTLPEGQWADRPAPARVTAG